MNAHTLVPLALVSICAAAHAQVDFTSLGNEMVNGASAAAWPALPYTCRQFSSYDRASVSPADRATWFANGDVNQFIRIDETVTANGVRKEWVMADTPGPGAIVRIWSPNPRGTLRVYADELPTPIIEAPMEKLLAGADFVPPPIAQSQSRGWNLYLPIPYAKHVRVTTDAPGSYYQVNYRTYEADADVRTVTREQLAAAGPRLAHWNAQLSREVPRSGTLAKAPFITLEPGGSCTAGVESGGGVISSVSVALRAKDPAAALRSVVLVGEFDGEQTIWCPIGDFFGTGTAFNKVNDVHRASSTEGELTCNWTMPFRAGAKFWLRNVGGDSADVKIDLTADRAEWNERSMHFNARWHSEPGIATARAAGTRDWNFATVQGRGVLVGDNLSVFNPVAAWWGEGDEKIYVDGEKFPSHFGTGTEDYYGYGWCDQQPFLHPFHGQMQCDGYRANGRSNNRGHTFVSRLRSLDAIPFTDSLRFDMEVWHWDACEVDYAATVYYYAFPGAIANITPDPAGAALRPREVPPPFRIPGAIECESLKPAAITPGLPTEIQAMDGYTEGKWSDESHLWVKGRAPGDFIELPIPCDRAGPVRVILHATRSWDYGVVRFSLNGVAGAEVDLFSGKPGSVLNPGGIDLGVHSAREGVLLLRAEVIGGNPDSKGTRSFFGLDCIELRTP